MRQTTTEQGLTSQNARNADRQKEEAHRNISAQTIRSRRPLIDKTSAIHGSIRLIRYLGKSMWQTMQIRSRGLPRVSACSFSLRISNGSARDGKGLSLRRRHRELSSPHCRMCGGTRIPPWGYYLRSKDVIYEPVKCTIWWAWWAGCRASVRVRALASPTLTGVLINVQVAVVLAAEASNDSDITGVMQDVTGILHWRNCLWRWFALFNHVVHNTWTYTGAGYAVFFYHIRTRVMKTTK